MTKGKVSDIKVLALASDTKFKLKMKLIGKVRSAKRVVNLCKVEMKKRKKIVLAFFAKLPWMPERLVAYQIEIV